MQLCVSALLVVFLHNSDKYHTHTFALHLYA